MTQTNKEEILNLLKNIGVELVKKVQGFTMSEKDKSAWFNLLVKLDEETKNKIELFFDEETERLEKYFREVDKINSKSFVKGYKESIKRRITFLKELQNNNSDNNDLINILIYAIANPFDFSDSSINQKDIKNISKDNDEDLLDLSILELEFLKDETITRFNLAGNEKNSFIDVIEEIQTYSLEKQFHTIDLLKNMSEQIKQFELLAKDFAQYIHTNK